MSIRIPQSPQLTSFSSEPNIQLNWSDTEYDPIIGGITQIYMEKIRPLEVAYNFQDFHSAPLTDADITAKPFVLLIGQYSTGKTTFIRNLLGKGYIGEHIGVEPTTDRFVAVMQGTEDRVTPGNAAALSQDLPFQGLSAFGQRFLSRFQVSHTKSTLLENMTIIDTPGILAGDKQRLERGYDYTAVIQWFAQRADLILLMFDSHKLDISDEFKNVIESLKGQDEKVRVILNKSDMVSQQQLMRVYGALMWSLGRVIQTPEVIRVYISSFWTEKPLNCFEESRGLIDAEMKDLMRELRDLSKNAAIRKINEVVKRARLAMVHAYIVSHLKSQMPIFGKKKKQEELLYNIQGEFIKIQQLYHIPHGDFPEPGKFKEKLALYDIDKFRSLRPELIKRVEEALSADLPRLTTIFPSMNPELEPSERNPFAEFIPPDDNELPPSYWHFSSVDTAFYTPLFQSLGPRHGRLIGGAVKPILVESGLSPVVLAQIWRLADYDEDGYMDINEFSIAMYLVKTVKSGGILPDKLPSAMLPPKKY